MTAFYDLLEIEYVEQDIERIGFATESEDITETGKSTGMTCANSTALPELDSSME